VNNTRVVHRVEHSSSSLIQIEERIAAAAARADKLNKLFHRRASAKKLAAFRLGLTGVKAATTNEVRHSSDRIRHCCDMSSSEFELGGSYASHILDFLFARRDVSVFRARLAEIRHR